MRDLQKKTKLLYGAGNLSNGITLQALTSYLVFFGTSILGISGTIVGVMVSISVVWDALSDLLIGSYSDNFKSKRFGRRHLFMILGTLLLGVTNYFLWHLTPELSMVAKVLWLFILMMLVKTFMTIYVTPYNALGGELTKDYYERTSIQGYRTVFFILGLMFTTVAGMIFYFKPSEAYPLGQLNPASYGRLGTAITIIILLSGFVAILGTWHTIEALANESLKMHKQPIMSSLRLALRNKNYLRVAGAYLSANIASAILGAIGLHVFTYTFFMDNLAIGVIFGVIFGLGILSQGFWVYLTKKVGKRKAAIVAVYLGLLGSMAFIVLVMARGLVVENFIWLLLYAVPSGICIGGLITLPFAMVSDTIDDEEKVSGRRAEGIYFGGLTFAYKMSQSAAIFIVGMVLDLSGYDGGLSVQTEGTRMILGQVVGVGTLGALLLTLYFYKRYEPHLKR